MSETLSAQATGGRPDLAALRSAVRAAIRRPEPEAVALARQTAALGDEARARICRRGAELVREVRASADPGLLESFLAEYGLSTREGVALMCLAEALLRVPDAETIDALIEDKIAPSDWGRHLGHSASTLVNASTWGLMLTGKVLGRAEDSLAGLLHGAVKRLGEPVIRTAVGQAMKELGRNFVLGREIGEAMKRAGAMEAEGYTYSYDMLGEAAATDADARRYHLAYTGAIAAIAKACKGRDPRENPGISVKLSALHCRYEEAQRGCVMAELVPRVRALALLAKTADMGFNIDAEEQDRLDLSLDVIEAVLSDPALEGWDGFGVVIQAFGPRCLAVIDWIHALAETHDRRIMVRLVKGAYWDTEIKHAQEQGLDGFPVFTRKAATDANYIAGARKLLGMTDRLYPQFATHNAHTVAAVLEMAGNAPFEFQRLHGMGERLHGLVHAREGARCRIYAPVGAHRDLLAYLVRRLLENGANSSFVNQIVDDSVSPEQIAADPFAAEGLGTPNPRITRGPDLYAPARVNSRGWDLTDPVELAALDAARGKWRGHAWEAAPHIAAGVHGTHRQDVTNPAHPDEVVGHSMEASEADIAAALDAAPGGAADWAARPVADRAAALNRAADAYEAAAPELFALCAREAGKTMPDAVAELREAVDFLRYYATEAARLEAPPRGVFACISPWNFPLAIFTGQVSAALAAGNAVIAKPAEQTPLIAARAVQLMHEAGVPRAALQLLPGGGAVGAALTRDPRIAGVAFTGSTETAQKIHAAMARHLAPDAPLIAETGGLNAMIVDSTALPEQAVRDIVMSAFRSAGQRCSALRMLYVQQDVSERLLEMLFGAMEALRLGDPWDHATDVGPAIDAAAKAGIEAHVAALAAEGRLLKRVAAPAKGHFVAPAVLQLSGIEALEREIFGPVLHVATFAAHEIDAVIDAINARGFGLTFGLHTRIDDRVQQVVSRIRAGNSYVNRNQIGAIVGSQPFGGEGLSGTGPKAGGPNYLRRFAGRPASGCAAPEGAHLEPATVAAALARLERPEEANRTETLPGPTGESNRLSILPRGRVLCLGPTAEAAMHQAARALETGNAALMVAPGAPAKEIAARGTVLALDGRLDPGHLSALEGFEAVASDAGGDGLRAIRQALAARPGPILPLVTSEDPPERLCLERHLCVDTTAAGGNASLLAAAESG
ncbi:bifunctional proline dehydrogenase/L-glutamate gamma-semialdehyde dehydrogenase PutA [Paralimibaculum aggregatum]|uniref:Bifunctional protein PutA n=1 Tax=Paralimibaculum aggregatum TaxID=3036245 RepID=A0ABQ6LTA6_9RHOB|nr:bifunctional proline dehydrogenase/L-glutamate gamma-semialdehyde dehydrogenase PutA [Limibaculum sp. NKW23]GMG85301.1 bifunctional proline dehydrogenase/L-glutamate gamma-semialdehyde dehydrogenase PutA [Limibaculum sp. NKW23]